MRIQTRLIALMAGLASLPVFSQQSAIYSPNTKDFDRALELYRDQQYQSAQRLFEKARDQHPSGEVEADCAYYIANCAIRLEQPGADALMEDFVANYPTSSKQNQAFREVAEYYFDAGDFKASLEWYDKVDESTLTAGQMDRYNFQKGYSYFVAKDKKQATAYLNKVSNSKEYGSQAKYYLGFMAYESDDYEEAARKFEQVEDQQKYREKMSYFQADMSFKKGDFAKAIEQGKTAMVKSTPAEKSELNKIIGESYFNQKQYAEAIPYLKEYKGKKGKWTNTDYYILGYAYYQQKDYENAISQFNKIIDGKDGVAQNAYYHLGDSYMKTDRKQQALNAFKNASEMDFDAKIQEDAWLSYAKLSYEIGNSYQPIPDVLQGFIDKYPANPNRPEIENLLVNSFITSKNYKGALALLEKNKTVSNKAAYKKVTFYRGLELHTDGSYQDALAMFKKSIATPGDAKFTARATFWKAETEYVLDQFAESLLSFKQFLQFDEAKTTPEFKNSSYNLAYAYFKQKEYDQAAANFQAYVNKPTDDKVRLNDAYLRLGDSQFVTGKYWPAMEAYNKAIEMKGIDADYAAFQKAISYGFVGRNEKKIDDLTKFVAAFPKSQYRDDALFELGNTYVAEKKTTEAVKTYEKLASEYKNSSYGAKAVLRQGLIYYNADNDAQALVKLKQVASEYPNTPEALEAVSTARLIYVDNGHVDEYAAWVRTLSYVEVSDAELDNDTYESAEKQYMQNNAKAAISGFSGYLAKFPNGLHALNANFYLAQLYYADGLETNAIPNYEFVVAKPRSEFTEQALARLAEIHLKQKSYDKAIPVLKRLEAEAEFPQNVTFAQANLMKSYYEKDDFINAVTSAEKVLANPKMDDKVRSDAQIIIARSAVNSGDEAKARSAYAKLLTIAKGEVAAEAQYYDAFYKNKDGKFEASNASVEKLTKNFSGYRYFSGKGLIVMAKNFYGLKDSFNATYILDSVVKNFTDFPDVVAEATAELDRIKSEEAKTNASIQQN